MPTLVGFIIGAAVVLAVLQVAHAWRHRATDRY